MQNGPQKGPPPWAFHALFCRPFWSNICPKERPSSRPHLPFIARVRPTSAGASLVRRLPTCVRAHNSGCYYVTPLIINYASLKLAEALRASLITILGLPKI